LSALTAPGGTVDVGLAPVASLVTGVKLLLAELKVFLLLGNQCGTPLGGAAATSC
jgi:hypothetical protein